MSATSVTLRGRNAALALMQDTVTITRVTGQSTDPQTGVVTNTTSTIYTGPAKIQQLVSGGLARPATAGEAQVWQLPLHVHVPMTVTGVQEEDVVTVTASVLDPDLVGRKFWVRQLAHKTYATARRLGLAEVVG